MSMCFDVTIDPQPCRTLCENINVPKSILVKLPI